ncbi:MAG: alanine racemase [Thermoanaerobaculia bacterium]
MSITPELSSFRPTFAEIDLDAFVRNVRAVRARTGTAARLVAVVKADAYGHGAVEVARAALDEGVDVFAVALLEEAIELRDAGIEGTILLLGPVASDEQIEMASRAEITCGVVGPEELDLLAGYARKREADLHIHLKLDSGMGRMGFLESDLDGMLETLRSAPSLRVDGVYSHFANASDPDDPYTETQLANFERMLARLAHGGLDAPVHHLANSAAVMRGLVTPGDFVRVGIALYGGEPMDRGTTRLEPLMRWRTEVARLKTLPPGSSVGYGRTFQTRRTTRVATLPVGYADGYDRLLSNRAEVLIRGRRVAVIGRVSMDLITIDVTDVEGVAIGDEVVLLGRQGDEEIPAEEIAHWTGTIPYEVFCRVSARVPRIYRRDGASTIRSRFAGRVRKESSRA